MAVEVTFPGGRRVDAKVGGFTVSADKSVEEGGAGGAPSPFDLFLASLATCAGMNVVYFFEHRKLSPKDVKMVVHVDYDDEGYMAKKITTEVILPADFPEEYRERLVRAVDACYVKKHVLNAPEFVTTLTPK